ncbi:hypothetical protein C7T94_11040 [Pedobacter yulinensis]|uniref:Macroglobulin domain-containing protein n=1 Tax=Pedobacter yulinensis TaxID=2126353 RepID=A0A2T3HL06_9SPHI|nr:hypothetical protein [Pedobacter yulinensis]PST83132.1 hypothetical protein C7T94_11040 [Pedobacter yulinensis]
MTRFPFFLLLVFMAFATQARQRLAEKTAWYTRSQPSSKLFVHFDKNIYADGETAWFTAYLFGGAAGQHNVLCVALVRDRDSALVKQEKFVMGNGLSFGQLQLPDSLATGRYRLVAFTNRVYRGRPEALFVQPVTVKTARQLPFHLRLVLEEPLDTLSADARLRLAVTGSDSRFLPKPVEVSYQYGHRRIKARTDVAGQLAFRLPLDQAVQDPGVYVRAVWKNDTDQVILPLILPVRRAVVGFYPEGGQLVCGLPGRVGLELHDQYGAPVAATATVYEDERALFQVRTNSQGAGRFVVNCLENRQYTLRIKHPQLRDSTFHLPRALAHGVAISMGKAVTGDTLRLRIMSNNQQQLNLYLHDFKNTFLAVRHEFKGQLQSLVFPLGDVPQGLCALTVTDSLDRPLAERLFYAHYRAPGSHVSVQPDKKKYARRQEVLLDLGLLPGTDTALVSIACVQSNRLSAFNQTDIVSHVALRDDLADFPLTLQALRQPDQLEDLLLLRGWRRYSWNKLITVRAVDTLVSADSMLVTGAVTRNGKNIRAATELLRFTGQQFRQVRTSTDGRFRLNLPDLLAPADKQVYIFLPGTASATHQVRVYDPYQELAQRYGRQFFAPPVPMAPMVEQENKELALANHERSITLQEVVIRKRPDDPFLATARGPNPCGDYVCRFNILNCPNHRSDVDNRPPERGKVYTVNGAKLIYPGCTDLLPKGTSYVKVNPVYVHKEFYVNTFTEPVNQAIWSTLYWNHAVTLGRSKTAQLRFFTGDTTGMFRIVVQGIGDAGVVYETCEIEVTAGGEK